MFQLLCSSCTDIFFTLGQNQANCLPVPCVNAKLTLLFLAVVLYLPYKPEGSIVLSL